MPSIKLLEPDERARIETAAQIVRLAYEPVAFRHGITLLNCPSFPAFLPGKQLESAMKSPKVFGYAVYDETEMIGFYMLRHMDEENILDISRLGVLPDRQGRGVGSLALQFMVEQGLALGAVKLHASIVDEDETAKDWLTRRGFARAGRLNYAGMPYKVAFMEKSIS